MLTIDKNQSAKYFLLELLSDQTRFRESAAILKRMHGNKLEQDWSAFGEESVEDTKFYDDWMEYKSIKMVLKDLENRISEIRRGDFSFA
jgi:AAA15 family ATPase/GTPase